MLIYSYIFLVYLSLGDFTTLYFYFYYYYYCTSSVYICVWVEGKNLLTK